MAIETANIENITFHYLVRNVMKLSKVKSKVFNTPLIKVTYQLTQDFFNDYGSLPFDLSDMTADQIIEYATESPRLKEIDRTKKIDDNFVRFKKEVPLLLSYDYNSFNREFAEKTAESFIKWEAFLKNLESINEMVAMAEPKPNTVTEIINNVTSKFISGVYEDEEDEPPYNVFDPESHKPPEDGEFIPTGWHDLDQMLENGKGLEKGTLTHFWGQTNIGKSIWLTSLAKNMSLSGHNVFFASLEMKSQKIIKRAGSDMFSIPINDYNRFALDQTELRDRISGLHKSRGVEQVAPIGEFWVQRFSAATPHVVFAAADKLAKQLGIKWGAIVIDYLGELESADGFTLSEMYALHKVNNSALYARASRYNEAIVTAHQIRPEFFNMDDYDLDAAAEGRGITHRTDNVFAIIQTDVMKDNLKYWLKILKARDNKFVKWKLGFDINYDYMRLQSNGMIKRPDEFIM